MKELKELIEIVSKVKVQKIEIIGQDASNNSKKSQLLYEGIASDQFDTDEMAALAIYGPSFKKDTYQKLKKHLEQKLLNTLFFIDVTDSELTDIQLTIYRGERLLAATRLLRRKGAFQIVNKLAKRGLKDALKYGFTELIIGFARILEEYHVYFTRNRGKSLHYQQLKEKYYEILGHELYLETKHQKLIANLDASNNPNPALLKEFDEVSRKLIPLFEEHISFKILNLGLNLILANFQLQGKYEQLLIQSDYFLIFLKKHIQYPAFSIITIITNHTLEACIHLKNTQKGEEIMRLWKKNIPKKSLSWLGGVELYLLLFLHTKNWKEAHHFFFSVEKEAMSLKGKAYELPQERLNIYKCYLLFLMSCGQIKGDIKKRQSIAIGKILNEIPIYSKDKRGINIPILIVQFLMLLTKRDLDGLQNRLNALNQYAWRYLKNDNTLRSNCFIKMLGCMIKADLHKNATIRTAKKYYLKLLANPARNYLNSHFIEVIPYENQWDLILSLLDNKAR